MKRRNNVKVRNAFFPIMGDVLAIFISASIALMAEGYKEQLTYPAMLWIMFNVVLITFSFYFTGHYSIVFKMISSYEIVRITATIILIGGLNVLFAAVSFQKVISFRGVLIFMLYGMLSTIALLLLRKISSVIHHNYINKNDKRTHVMIVGAGSAGVQLIKEMNVLDKVKYVPVCIVDDDLEKQNEYVGGIKVCGTTEDVEKLVKEYSVKEIFITMPSVSKKRVSDIVRKCKNTGCVVKTLPDLSQLANGKVTLDNLKPVDVKDLLGREQTEVNLEQIKGYIKGKVVLVTGGGGSIGSELCRQIITFNPAQLIILDNYENNAYEIEQELQRKYPHRDILALIANIREMGKMEKVFSKYKPQIVFHAAAHKHVPLMETSPNEAVKNNVFGTLNLARCADKFGVETFVQISTDKAVNPTNIMGATKRICEMIIQTIGKHSKSTKFVAVRFGNVLGSNGSVIPLFKKQIEEGGPVTVTHKDVVRYFMTIQEAVTLVLQAGAFAKSGQIFVLDMGEQVRIYDLACNLIRLSGYEPNVDIDIVCTGLRPGEKLYEERLMDEEGLQKTSNGQISIARPINIDEDKLWTILDRLYKEAYEETENMKYSVKELVDTYTIDERF
ncbi:MAG: polysaccharide biosynthesis protein [Clostridia bacterium]|nr:polysaccharide biosynthesis protein [Clostridia bacterium]